MYEGINVVVLNIQEFSSFQWEISDLNTSNAVLTI